MAIPALSTADKLFICSYNIGSNIDHRKALGNINEYTTFTSEYIDGFCWIPVRAPQETNDHSWWWDLADKDTVYVKVGVRVSADGYLHAWLTSSQKVSELILWNNAYNTTNSPTQDTTTLHWVIEKLYRVIFGNTTSFVVANIKFQKYTGVGSTRLYLFGNYNNSLTNSVKYTIDPANVQASDFSWYPNNATTVLGDYLFSADETYVKKCQVQGTGGAGDWWGFSGPFGKSPDTTEPIFYRIDSTPTSTSIPSICDPADPTTKTINLCNRWVGTATGNNSGRLYSTSQGGADCMSCTGQYSWATVTIDISPNVCYVWVPDDPGPPPVPGHYICCPAFVYDSSVSFNYGKFNHIVPDQINYLGGNAQFVGLNHAQDVFARYYQLANILDSFNEIGGDLDILKHGSFVDTIITPDPPGGNEGCALRTIFTKHVGIGLLTDADVTINVADWYVLWGAAYYFSNWQVPDGLAVRTPAVTNTPYTRPITHHDEFSVVSGEPVLGGFLYSLLTSNAFLGRDPGTETKSVVPVSNLADFSFLYKLITSNAFLGRDPGTETKSVVPVSNLADFSFLYKLITSNAFLGRDPGTETKILHPICNDADFSFLYKFEEFILAKLYHLKIDGDDTKDGLSWTNAWKHWTYAAANTPDERTLLVEEGTYNDGETIIGPTNSIIIFLVKNGVDGVSTVTVVI